VTGDWRAAWGRALDELELDLAATEALLATDHRAKAYPVMDPWRPPAGLGPLPLELRPRADAIVARQLATVQAIGRAMMENRRRAQLLHRVGDQHRPALRPAYVDTAM
jgi:hypothetical protein